MPGLNVVALISGGKDSLFSILHCQRNGHRVVALANLHPPNVSNEGRADDLESYMYQTIGHSVIPLYEEALGLPLYRQEIVGSAVDQSKVYGQSDDHSAQAQDETESLVPLLQKVMLAHPEINAVSTGAILSDYQRTRVESVALRLNLIPLSYLWQWPFLAGHTPSSLLQDMAAAGQDARIIKVASGGLDESFLWQNVADPRTIARLSNAAARFGTASDGAVIGEGGEYETLAMSGPAPLWRGRIVVAPEAMQVVTGEAGSASLSITTAAVETVEETDTSFSDVSTPSMFDEAFKKLLDTTVYPEFANDESKYHDLFETSIVAADDPSSDPHLSQADGDMVPLAAMVGDGSDVTAQTRAIMEQVRDRLTQHNLLTKDVAYTTIVLRNMSEFAAVNAVYGSYFRDPNPPARLTIACAGVLPENSLLSISMTLVRGSRDGLHVQSRSYWAPANIGPYSQAIGFPAEAKPAFLSSAVLVSGQIPLVPAQMDLFCSAEATPEVNFVNECALALQHLMRIGQVMKVRSWSGAIAFVTLPRKADLEERAAVVRHMWNGYHTQEMAQELDETDSDADDGFDIWHVRHGFAASKFQGVQAYDNPSPSNDDQRGVPPLSLIVVDELPRGASIEWVGSGSRAYADAFPKPLHLRDLMQMFQRQPDRFHQLRIAKVPEATDSERSGRGPDSSDVLTTGHQSTYILRACQKHKCEPR